MSLLKKKDHAPKTAVLTQLEMAVASARVELDRASKLVEELKQEHDEDQSELTDTTGSSGNQ